MDPLPPREPLEHEMETALRRHMERLGWHTEKTHGNLFQKGWPDLYCMHKGIKGVAGGQPLTRWIEVKRDNNELEPTQKKKFLLWQKHGVKVWVLRGPEEYDRLFQPPNWMWWLDPTLKKLT